MAGFASTKLYPDMSQLIGSGKYKNVYGATRIIGTNDDSIGIESSESPEKVVVAVCKTSISNGIIGSRIIDEIILQNEVSQKTPQLAPYIYGAVVKTQAGNITTYVGEDLVFGTEPSKINNIIKELSRGDMIYIYQQRCDSDLSTHITLKLSKIDSDDAANKELETKLFIGNIHISIKSLFDNIVKSGYFCVDIKSRNICHFNESNSAKSVNIGLDMDPAFTHPFEQKLRDTTPPIDNLEKIISDFSKNAIIFMLIMYYILFTYKYKQHTGIVSQLLSEDGIGYAKIFEMLKFMEEPKYHNIFQYDNAIFMPVSILKHYFSYNLKNEIAQNNINMMLSQGKTVSNNDKTKIQEGAHKTAIFDLDRMTLEELATKICEILRLPFAPSLTVSAPEKSAGSRRRRRPRKMNSRKKHLNKRTHKTINARTSKSNPK